METTALFARRVFEGEGCRCIAHVIHAEDVRDLAFLTSTGATVMVRCSERPLHTEANELVTVIAQQTFDDIVLLSGKCPDCAEDFPVQVWSVEDLPVRAGPFARALPAGRP